MSLMKDFKLGLWKENPVFKLLLGMCPVLAVTTAAVNGLAMGLATSFVLMSSSTIVSLINRFIPSKVRIPCYIIVIATFVTITDLFISAYFPDIHKVLGLFIPLIVVNCLILGRSEAFASKNNVIRSIFDAVGMGVGFTWALVLLSMVRELFGSGTIFNIPIFGESFTPIIIMILPPGAFIALGILLGILNYISLKSKQNSRKIECS